MTFAVRIVDLDEYGPCDGEILSFFAMLGTQEQRQWDYQVDQQHDNDTPAQLLAWFRNETCNDNHLLWAVADRCCLGMIGVNVGKGPKTHCGELGIAVAADVRRRGIGQQLMQAAVQKARDLGLRRLEADCFADNLPAIGLLRVCGFSQEGVRHGAILKEGRLRDQVLFGLLL